MYHCKGSELCPLNGYTHVVPGLKDLSLDWPGPACEHLIGALPEHLPNLQDFGWILVFGTPLQSKDLSKVIPLYIRLNESTHLLAS
jgi:hypothetical protein